MKFLAMRIYQLLLDFYLTDLPFSPTVTIFPFEFFILRLTGGGLQIHIVGISLLNESEFKLELWRHLKDGYNRPGGWFIETWTVGNYPASCLDIVIHHVV